MLAKFISFMCRLKHFVSFGDYKQIFPEANVDLPTWRCLVCNINITWARRPIQQHLSGTGDALKG
jgi:hypothetical protein